MMKQVKYECLSGYAIDDEGMYQVGDDVPGIGPVQDITDVDEDDD